MAVTQQRRGTSTDLKADYVTIFPAGQIIIETDTNRIKVGDGVNPYASLPYYGGVTTGDQLFALDDVTLSGPVSADDALFYTNNNTWENKRVTLTNVYTGSPPAGGYPSGTLGATLSLKADLVDGKVPSSQLPASQSGGVSSFNNQTGDITYNAPVTSVNNQTGDVVISGGGGSSTLVDLSDVTVATPIADDTAILYSAAEGWTGRRIGLQNVYTASPPIGGYPAGTLGAQLNGVTSVTTGTWEPFFAYRDTLATLESAGWAFSKAGMYYRFQFSDSSPDLVFIRCRLSPTTVGPLRGSTSTYTGAVPISSGDVHIQGLPFVPVANEIDGVPWSYPVYFYQSNVGVNTANFGYGEGWQGGVYWHLINCRVSGETGLLLPRVQHPSLPLGFQIPLNDVLLTTVPSQTSYDCWYEVA